MPPGTWTGTTGVWSAAANWASNLVPNDPALDVSIDGGRTGTNSNVTLDISVNVRNLTIDTGDRLTILNGAQLTLNGTTLTDNGQITINAGGGRLTLAPGTLITGTGSLFLVGGTSQMGSTGTITQDVGHTLQGSGVVSGAFVNNGLVLATGGTLNFSGGFTQNAGLLNLTGGTVSSPTPFQINGGSLTGVGIISGSVNNKGVMQPLFGSGGLAITGALSLASSSSLIFNLGGTILGTQYGLINVSGSASLAGQFNALFSGGFQTTVTNANVFTVLLAGSPLTGAFANIASGGRLTTGDGFGSFLVTYAGNQVILSDYLASITNFVAGNWLSASGGAWNTAANWSSSPFFPNDGTPSNGTGYNVTINATGSPYTVTLGIGVMIQNLTLNSANATLSLDTGANLRIINSANLQNGTLAFNSGTLRGGTLNLTGGLLTFSNSGSNVMNNVQVIGGFAIANANGILRLDGGTQISGTVNLSAANTLLAFNQDATMTGLTVNMGSAGINAFVSVEGNHTVTLDNTVFLHGVGNIGQARIIGGNRTLINQGTISADLSGQTLTINPVNFTNQGTLNAINGAILTLSGNVTNSGTIVANASTLNLNGTFTGGSTGVVNATNSAINLGGNFTTAGLNQITRVGGTLTLSGTLNNAGTNFALTPALGVLTLNGGTISGGTVDNTGGQALAFSNSGSNILNNVIVNGGLTISNSNGTVRLDGGSQINGAVTLSGSNSLLAFNQDATMTGLTVSMGSAGINAFVSVEGNHTVTLDNTVFLHGVGNIGQARIIGGNGTLINQGIISADLSGQTLTINPVNFTNQGTLNAINGAILTLSGNVTNSGTIVANASTLNLNGTFTGGSTGVVNATNSAINLGGNFTTAGLNQITRVGGTLTLSGTLNNAGTNFALTPALGVLTLNGGTISGGTVDNTGGQALAFSNSGSNILNNVIVNGGLTISNSNGTVRLDGGSQINGAVTLSGINSLLAFNQDATMTGLTVNMGSAGINAFVSVEGNHTVTLDNTVSLHGVGNIGQARIIGGNGTLINQGIISADLSGQTLTINPMNFTNQGTLNAINGAILTLSGNVTNSGTIVANASTLNLNGTFTGGSTGVVNATNSAINLGGNFTTAGLNQITRVGGTLTLSGTLNNAGTNFALTPALGVLTLNGGTISGGTVDNTGGQALAFSNSGSNILSNVIGQRRLHDSNSNGTVRLDDGSQITGTVTLSGSNSLLAFNQDATMTGLTVNMGSAGINAFVSVEGNHTVTLDNTIFLHGVGNIGQARIIGRQRHVD